MADQNCKDPNFFLPTTPHRRYYRRKSAETICETLSMLDKNDIQMDAGNKFSETFSIDIQRFFPTS